MGNGYRWTHLYIIWILLVSTFVFAIEDVTFKGWAHLELGAGNYGADGHTQASQTMTVLMQIENVTQKENYIDKLDEKGKGNYQPEEQYGVLFVTLDELVRRYGKVGVFHVNDLYKEYAIFAAQKLIEYAESQGYDSVIIETVSGDYQKINPIQTLFSYGRIQYTTAHLKNPEVSLYSDTMDGDNFYASDESRKNTRSMLNKLAHLSETGLYLFILYHPNFIPLKETTEFVEKHIFYHETNEWDPVPYIFPEGNIIDKEYGRVFHILPNESE